MRPEKTRQAKKQGHLALKKIETSGLFGRFDHVLEFSEDDPVVILTGPNGFGKTTILNAVNVLFNRSPWALAKLPFNNLSVEFDDASKIDVDRINIGKGEAPDIEISYVDADPNQKRHRVGRMPDSGIFRHIEYFLPSFRQIDGDVWLNRDTGERFTLDGIAETFGDGLPWREMMGLKRNLPEWFEKIRKDVSVRLIDADRLTFPARPPGRLAQKYFHPGHKALSDRTIDRYSRELSDKVNDSLAEYGALSQTLDRTFPSRVVEETLRDVTMEHLQGALAKVEEKWTKLVNAGLLAQEREDWNMLSAAGNIDPAKQALLAVYARDARKKLSLFDDLCRKIDTLKRIANERFLHKTVSVDADGLSVTDDEGSDLDFGMLSSGEQHELAILYELLFQVPDNGFVLFDEPEMSLHVAWQEKFLEDLMEMAEISNFRVLLATHSPQIIGDHWDLTMELKGPDGLVKPRQMQRVVQQDKLSRIPVAPIP